jgi:FixJ family two-component response regulator
MNARLTRVAILDDDVSVGTAIERLLNASRMEAKSFATSAEFLASLENGHPDCLVLDLRMPGLDGMDVMHRLRQCGISLPVVVITAHDEPGSRERCLGAGASAWLRKPLDAIELIVTIDSAIAVSRESMTAG